MCKLEQGNKRNKFYKFIWIMKKKINKFYLVSVRSGDFDEFWTTWSIINKEKKKKKNIYIYIYSTERIWATAQIVLGEKELYCDLEATRGWKTALQDTQGVLQDSECSGLELYCKPIGRIVIEWAV